MTVTEILLKNWFCNCCRFDDLFCTRFDPAHGTIKHSGTQRPDRHHEARLNRVLGSRVLTVVEHIECNADLRECGVPTKPEGLFGSFDSMPHVANDTPSGSGVLYVESSMARALITIAVQAERLFTPSFR